ncbi:MAG: endonuclease/exonuclease/phosphatase family protein [Pirellulaceae bacterium]|nr:endonuclease/exonuclease/phosphatase family protein [Pirellulaceae bacterium]
MQIALPFKTVMAFLSSIVLSVAAALPCFAQDDAPEKLVVVTWNVEWMYDDDLSDNRSDLSKEQSAPSKAYWQTKLDSVSAALAATGADIIALQEIEGDQTLIAIAAELRQKHKLNYRHAFIPGSDRFTEQDVGLLFRSGLTQYRRHEQTREMFDSNNYYNISKHLVGEFNWKSIASPLTVMTVHLRATAEAEDFRIRQARLARHWLTPQLNRGEDVILLGDLNTEHPVDDNQGDMLELAGTPESGNTKAASPPPMVDLLKFLPTDQRTTHLILPRAFDRMLVSQSLIEDGPDKDWVFKQIEVRRELVIRGKQDGQEHWDNRLTLPVDELDTSDHFPLVATFELK